MVRRVAKNKSGKLEAIIYRAADAEFPIDGDPEKNRWYVGINLLEASGPRAIEFGGDNITFKSCKSALNYASRRLNFLSKERL